MSDVEYRAHIRVPVLEVASENAGRLLSTLELHHGEMGPVLSGCTGGLDVVLAADADSPSTTAEAMYVPVADSLRLIGEPDPYPHAVEIEPARSNRPRMRLPFPPDGRPSIPGRRSGSPRW